VSVSPRMQQSALKGLFHVVHLHLCDVRLNDQAILLNVSRFAPTGADTQKHTCDRAALNVRWRSEVPPYEVIEAMRARAPEILKIDVTAVEVVPGSRWSPPMRSYLRYCGTAVVENVVRSVFGVTAGASLLLEYETIPPVDTLPPAEWFESLGQCHQPLITGRCTAFLKRRGYVFEPISWCAFSSSEWQVGSEWPRDVLSGRVHKDVETKESYWDLLDRSHPLLPPSHL
jgi:hypothetical protein